MDPDMTSDNAQALDDSGTSPEILDSTVSRIWYSVSSFPGLFWNVLCWQLNPLIKLYYVIVTSLDGSRGKQRKLICWLEAMCGREVRNLQAVWEDGSIVCDVINAVMVGSCEPKDHHGNCLRHAQELASHHFKLLPVFSNTELQKPFNSSLEKRLWRYLLSLRNALKHRLANNIADQEEKDPEYLIAEEYVARGMGLILASRAERAIFFIYSRDDSSLADIHVHIKGPHGDCGEATAGEPIDSENHTIAIDYRLTPDYLKVCYIPNNLGYHELSLTRYGFNIPGSPFIIKVGEHTGPPSDKFSYLEWLTDEQEERRRLEMEKKRKMKVVSRVIDFITEKMHMTDDGHLVRIDEASLRVPSPVPHNLKRTGRSLSPRPRCKLSSQKRSKSLTNQKLIQAAEFLKCSTPNFFEEKKCVQDAASQVSDDFSMINSVRIDQFQEKCQRIVKACDFLLSHAPKQKSLEILSTAEKILDIPYNNTLTHHKSLFELYRPDNSVTPDINIQNLATESSRSSETDEEKEVIKPCTPEINVTRVDFSDRLYSMRKFDDDGLNAVSSFNSSSSTNENISTPHLNREKDRSKSTSPQKDAKMARKSFQTVGYTKAKRSSQTSFPTSNISDEICPSDNKNEKIEENQNQIIGDNKEMTNTPTVIGENEEKQHDSVEDVENLSNVQTVNTIEGIAEDNRDTTNEKWVDSSDLFQRNTEEEIDFEHSSTRQSRSREPKLTRNSKQAKKVSNLVKQFENQSVRSSASPLRNELVLVKYGETGDGGDKVDNSVKTPIEKKELSGTNIGIIGKDFGVEMDDGKILEYKKSLKAEINYINILEVEVNNEKSLNVEISSEKSLKTEKNDGKILETDISDEKILEAQINDEKSLEKEINNEQVLNSNEDDSEIIKITGETKENSSGADICDLQPSEKPDEISDFVCNSRIEVEQDIKCYTNEDQTITVDETDEIVEVTSEGNEKEDSNTQNKTDDSIHEDKKQSEIIENTNNESALIENKDEPGTLSEIAAETAIVGERTVKESFSGGVLKEELQAISSIKSRISTFENLSRKNVSDSVADNKEDESIHHSRKKVTPTEDKKVELNNEFLAEVNEENSEDIKRAGKLLKEENSLEEVMKEDIGLENKEEINNFENLSKSDSPVEVEGMNEHIENVGKDGVEKHSDEISNFVDDERIDDSNKCSDNQSELQPKNDMIDENTLKQSNITDEVFNEECVLLSVKHLSFDSESNRFDKEEHVVDEVDKRDIDDNTLLDGDTANKSPTSENVIINPLKDETLIVEKPIENTVLENLDDSEAILEQNTVDDKIEEMPNKYQDGIDKIFVSGLAFSSVQGSTLAKEVLGIQNEVESKSDDSLNSITGEEVTSNIGSINEDHVNVTGSEPLADMSPSEVLAEIDTTRNIEEDDMKLEIIEQSDDVQKRISSTLEPITGQINATTSQTDIESVTGGRTEEATDCIPTENKPENDENIVCGLLEAASVGPSMVIDKNGENNDEGKKKHSIIMNNDTSVPCNNTETLIEKNNLESEGSDTKVYEITENESIKSQLENELLENEKNGNSVNKMKADVSEVLLTTENVSNVTDDASGAPVTENQKSEEDVIEENIEGNRNENFKMNISEKLDDNNEILEVDYTDLNIVSTSEEALSKSNEDDNANETLENESDYLVNDNGETDEIVAIDDKPSESSVDVINEEENKSETIILENSQINIPLEIEQNVLLDSNKRKIFDDVKIASDEIVNSSINDDLEKKHNLDEPPSGENGTSSSKTGADKSDNNECFPKGDPSSENEERAETLQNDKLIIDTVSRIILGVVGMDIGTNIEQVSEISSNVARDSNEKIPKSPEVENIDSIEINSVDCLKNDTSDNNKRDFVGSDEINGEDSIQEQIIIADIGGAKYGLNIIDSEENKTVTDEARVDTVQENLSKSNEDQLMSDSKVSNDNEKRFPIGITLLNKSDIANAAVVNKVEIDDMAIIQDPETSNSGGEFLEKDVDEQKESYFETGGGVKDLVADTEGTRHIEAIEKIEEKSSNDEESNEVDELTNDNIIEKIHENSEVIKHEKNFDEPGEEFDSEEDRNKENLDTVVTDITKRDVIDEKCQNKEIGPLDTEIDPISVEDTSRENIASNNSDTGVNKIIPSIEPLQNTEIDTTTNSCEDSSNIESCRIERDELLVGCDKNENNIQQFDHNSECNEPPNETEMHPLGDNNIDNIHKETVITEDNSPQVFEVANQNTNEKNTETDNLEVNPSQIIESDNKGTTGLINKVECSLENKTSKECSVKYESHIIENEIKNDQSLENNGEESEKRKIENFTEETKDEAFIHENQRSPTVDNNNFVSSKEESDELIIKADANSEVIEDSVETTGREPDDSTQENEIMEAVDDSITETVESREITEINEGITENTVSVIETFENGKEANEVEGLKIQNNLDEIGENVHDPSDKIVIEQELQENTSRITEEDLEEKIEESEYVIIEQVNFEIEKTEQCIDLQQNDIEKVVENTNDISYSIDTIEEPSIVKEDDEIPKNELRVIESAKDEHVNESEDKIPIIDIQTEERFDEHLKDCIEQSDEVCLPLNESTVEQNKLLENSLKEGISTNEEIPEYDKSVQEIIVVNESENTEMEIEGNRENDVQDFDIDFNFQSNDEIGNEKLLVECNGDASNKLESDIKVSDLVEITDEKSDVENSSKANDEIPIISSNNSNPELESQIVIESENNIISNESSQLIDVNETFVEEVMKQAVLHEENIMFSPKPEEENMGEALLDPITCEAHSLLQKEHVDIVSSPSSDICDKLDIELEIHHSSHEENDKVVNEELINVDEIEKTVDNSEGTGFSMIDKDITDGDNNLVGEKTGRPVTELQCDGVMISSDDPIGTGPSSPNLLVKLEESEQSSPLLESEKITDDVGKDENTINIVQEIEISNDHCINSQENVSLKAEVPLPENLKDFSEFETEKSLIISEKLENNSPITPCSQILEDNQTPNKAIINDVYQLNEKDVNSQENQELPIDDIKESSLKIENNDNKSIDNEVTIGSIDKDAIRKIDLEENVDIEDEITEYELSPSKNSYERIIPDLIITSKDEELDSCNIEKGDGIDIDFGQNEEISNCEMKPFSETNEDISIMTTMNINKVEIGESQDFGLEELETCENELVSSDFIESCQPNEGLFDKELVDDLDLNIDEMDSISPTKTTKHHLIGEIATSEEKIVEHITSYDTSVDKLIEINQTPSIETESLLSINKEVNSDNLNISCIENCVLDETMKIEGLNEKEHYGSILENDTIRNSDKVVSNNVKVDIDQKVIQNAENEADISEEGIKESILLSCNEPTSVVNGDTPIATFINLMSENLESDNKSDQQISYPGSNINDNIIVSDSPADESILESEHIGTNESVVIEEDKNKIKALEEQSIESNTLDIITNTKRDKVKIEDNDEQEEEELKKLDRIMEEKDVDLEMIDVNDDSIPVENELTSDKTADMIETKEEVNIEANDEQEKEEFKKEDCIIEEKGVDLEIIDINDDSIPVENGLTSDKTAIIDSSSGVECIRNESPSTFQLSELSLGRQETFLLVSSSNIDTTDESTKKCGVKGLIERFSNNTTTSPSASSIIKFIVQQDNVKYDPLSGKLEGGEFYEADDIETGHSNKLSQLIKHFESNTVDKPQRNVLTTDEIVKVATSDNDVIEDKVGNRKDVIENNTCKDSEFDPTNIPTILTDVISDEKDYEDETFSSQHEFDLCSIGSHDDDVVSKSYTDINDGSNDSLTKNGNFGSTEHLLLCVGGMAELEDSEIQPATTNEEEMNKSDLKVDDGRFNEINSLRESGIELIQQDQSLIIVELTETINHEIDRNDEIGSMETSGEVIKRYGTSNDLLADLMLEENLIKNKAEDEEKSLVSFIQIDESMDLKEEEIVKSELEEHPLIVEEAGTEVDNIDLQSQCVDLIDSENSGENFNQDSSSTLNDVLKVVVNSGLSQNEMASQETSIKVPSEVALPPLVETHSTENSSELNETNENPVESLEPRDVCYEILNEISNEKSKTEEDSFLKTSISDKQGTDSTGSELNRSISLIVNSSLESDFCSNLQDEPISECVLETLLSKNENLESVEEPERDSIEDNVLSTEAGEACVEINQKQTTEEFEWLDKQTNELEEPASLSSFNLWPSNTDCKPSNEPNTTVELSEDIDFDSIISAPSLDEALKKFEKRLSDKMSKETTSTIQQIIKSEVLEIEQTENKANHDRIMMEKQDEASIEFGNSQNKIKIDNDINLKQENENDSITQEENTSTDNEKLQSKTVPDNFNPNSEIDSFLINNECIITPNAVTPDLKESVELESWENEKNSNQLLEDDENSNSFTERATVLEEAIVTENSESDSNKNNLFSELLNNKDKNNITQNVEISVDNTTLTNTVNSQKVLSLNSEIGIMVDENNIMDNSQIDSYLTSENDSFLRNEEHPITSNKETSDDNISQLQLTHGNSEIDLLLGSGEYSVPQAIETINDNELYDTKNSQIETNLMCDTGSLLVNLDDIKDSIEPNMKISIDSKLENYDSSQIEFHAECEINSPLKNSDNNGSSMTPMLIDTLINEGSTNHPSESDSNIDNSDLLEETIHGNAVRIETHEEDLKENIDLVSSADTLLIDQSSTSQNDAEISSHTNSLLEPLPVNIDVEESIDHSFEYDESIQVTQSPEPVIKYCVPCVDTTSYPPLSNHCSRPSSRMEVIREETEEITDNLEVGETREEGLSPLDSDDVSVSDISECLEKFDSLIQETELRDRDLLGIDENMLVEISVTDCDTGEHSDNLLLAESEIPECDRIIDELVDNSNSELGHQDLQGNEDIDSRDERIVDVYEIHDIVHDKSPTFNLNADLNPNYNEKSVEKISSGDIFVKEGKSTGVSEDDCKKSERKPRKSLVKSKKMFWDEKLKSLQAEQENKSKLLIEKRTKTGSKDHSNRNIVQPALKINRGVNQQYDEGEVPDTKISSTSKMNKSVSQQCNKQKMPDTKNEIRNMDYGKQSHSNTQSKPNLKVEEPVKIVVDLSDENNEIVDDRKSVDNWKNYWNNLLVNEKDVETQAMSRQPSIRVKGIVASSRSLFENANTNLERSVSCEILTNKSVKSVKNDKNRVPARSVGENLNEIGLETPVKSSHIHGENSETLQRSESVSNILERIKFFERSSYVLNTEARGGNNIEMTMNLINRKKCSLENTSTPSSPTTIKIDYFDDNQDESLPCQTLRNKKMKSESMDSSDGDLYNPLTMTLSGRVRSFSTGKIDETPDGSLSNIEEDRSAKGSDQCLEKSDEELKNTSTGMLEITTQLSRAKSEGNLSMSEKVTSRARFEQAKSFFKCLEEENLVSKKVDENDCLIPQKPRRLKQISMDSDSCGEGCKPKKKESKYRRRGRRRRKDSSAMKVRSAPTSDSECRMSMYDREFGGSERHKRISERFHVKHLFRDIAGDTDGIFKGIPNRKAVLASLEDLRADSVPDDQQDYEEPSRSHSLSSIPSGYQDEYPYLPTTPPSQYKHRSQLEDRLISRCKLVTYEMEI